MRNLKAVAGRMMVILDDCNIPYGVVDTFEVNTRALKRWGQCRKLPNGHFSININADLLNEKNDIRALEETLLHELIHTAPGCFDHKDKWQYYANRVNNRYGYNVKRASTAEEKGVTVCREKPNAHKYLLVCCKCGAKIYKSRMCDAVRYPEYSKHVNCGGGQLKRVF